MQSLGIAKLCKFTHIIAKIYQKISNNIL